MKNIGIALFLLGIGLGGCGNGGNGANPDLSAVPVTDLKKSNARDFQGFKSCCGNPGDQGNSKGVGHFCVLQDDCMGLTAFICSTIQDSTRFFCTIPCTKTDGGDPCGENAMCQCQGNQCGCVPNACITPPAGC